MNIRGRLASLLALLIAGASVLVSAEGGLAAADVAMPRLDALWVTIAGVALTIGAGRLLLDWDRYAASIVVGGAAVALTCAGEVRANRLYLVFVVAFVASALFALRNGRVNTIGVSRRRTRDIVYTAALLVVASAIGLAWAAALPPAYRFGERVMMHTFDRYNTSTGLTERIDLDSLDGMIQSDRVVLRVYGPAPESLRGVVYDRYEAGHWRTLHADDHRLVRVPTHPGTHSGLVTVRRVDGPTDRWFTTLGAGSFSTPAGRLHVDPYGVPRVAAGEDADVLSFVMHGRDPISSAPPSANDLAMPNALHAPLGAILAEWQIAPGEPSLVMRRLVQKLYAEYRYALQSHRSAGRDPVLDFLRVHREGHCEYFASALALLGRSAGVATRVVTGYRVAERSPLGGYYIVREQNAHAWVEAFIPGQGWRSFDATPGSEVPQNRFRAATWAAALADGVRAFAASVAAFIASRTVSDLIWGAGLLALLYIALRWSRARREAREAARNRGQRSSDAMEGFARLGAALERAGVERHIGETLERYAQRIEALRSLGEAAGIAATAIHGYAAYRYGGGDNEAVVVAELARATVAATASKPST